MDRHNDGISFAIEEGPDGRYTLLDDGYYLSDFQEGTWQEIGDTLVRTYNVQVNNVTREISLTCPKENLSDALSTYFQAIVWTACR